ncbi:unnamed protein product [Cylindrotheca closterium]|uniref:Haem-binding uptake Tiki superfamily ChaN domain-containing protein n=1 Tax=Cylindrotheca closterium TaxID=2856 RepID=A0AAD2CQA3_9STRA|nr:unnamed protein product [Cylindrotheca closterium]
MDDTLKTYSRKHACQLLLGGLTSSAALVTPNAARAEVSYQPASRPTSYRVDSTQPPTLIPVGSARKEAQVLEDLGKGYGTTKAVILDDRVNLNNVLNKAVFGTISALSGSTKGKRKSGTSFVCFGVPTKPTPVDIDLAVSLLLPILKARKRDTAIGIPFCPISGQSILDAYAAEGNEENLLASLLQLGIPESQSVLYLPLMMFARSKSLRLLALLPEKDDILVTRMKGLQNLEMERRASYVSDTDGFISTSSEPSFRLYAEKSLLKDYIPINDEDKPSGYFAERILVHETAATVASKYAATRPDSLVVIAAPINDLRFLRGINGRIPRVYNSLDVSGNKITDDYVTTILLNPTANDTLSKSRYLRLEIGTGPDTLDFQTKIADYLWFSSSPKVNMIPRLMNG